MKYSVEGTYQTPEWWSVEIEAEDDIEAEELALAEIRQTAPEEAIEFDITEVKVLD